MNNALQHSNTEVCTRLNLAACSLALAAAAALALAADALAADALETSADGLVGFKA